MYLILPHKDGMLLEERSKMKNRLIIFYGCILISLSGCGFIQQFNGSKERTIAVADAQKELQLLYQILEANHPSLDWYITKDSLTFYFQQVQQNLQTPLTLDKYRNQIAWLIAKIKCGHTAVKFPSALSKNHPNEFPLVLKYFNDTAVVLANANKKDSVLKRGVVVTAIQHQPIQKIIDSISTILSTDGDAQNFKHQIISYNFPLWYRTVFGTDTTYSIQYLDAANQYKDTIIRSYTHKADTSKSKLVNIEEDSRKQRNQRKLLSKRSLMVDPLMSTAYMRLSTFSSGRLKKFFKHSFKTIEQKRLQHLIIDLRENGGGNVMQNIRLAKYIAPEPFKVLDSVVAVSRKFKYGKYLKPKLPFWLSMQFFGRKSADEKIHFKYFEGRYFNPKKKYHFDGDVYIIQGGYTFSAATLFISSIQNQPNVTLVGEETGGGSYGTSAMHLTNIHLPYSKITINLPLYRLVVDRNLPKNGRGILPDKLVWPTVQSIQQGVDLKMQTIKELIEQKKAKKE